MEDTPEQDKPEAAPDPLASMVASYNIEKDIAPIVTRDAIERLVTSTERSSRVMIALTVVLVILTLVAVALTVVVAFRG